MNPSNSAKPDIGRDPPPESFEERGFLPWIPAALALLIVLAMGWVVLAPRGSVVHTMLIEPSSTSGIEAYGFVAAPTHVTVFARVPGRVQQMAVAEGSVVRQGQTIATLESGDYQTALEAARDAVSRADLQVAQAKNAVALAEDYRERQVISELDLQKLRIKQGLQETELQEARVREERAQANLTHTSVRAPFAGTVLRTQARAGDAVTPATPIAALADLTTLEAEVEVNETVVARFAGDEPARITIDAYPGRAFAGRVRQIGPAADRPQRGAIPVAVSILDPDRRILPGMSAKVVFGDSAGASVSVPKSAVLQDDQGAYVWLVERGRAHAHTVEPGPERGDRVEIESGLSGGERVIVDPSASLREGTRVRALHSP